MSIGFAMLMLLPPNLYVLLLVGSKGIFTRTCTCVEVARADFFV